MTLANSSSVFRVPGLALVCLAVLGACGGDAMAPSGLSTSFGRIQAQILAPTCITCHTAGNAFATQSGLQLDPAGAYQNLVSVAPTSATARADGLLRVKPFRADSSLLYYKLRWEAQYHVRDYGNLMPLGGKSLSVGQIEFIRRWIAGGASRSADDIDTTLLGDATPPALEPFAPLAPPPAGQGFQLKIDSFAVGAQFEREFFVYRALGNPRSLFVSRIVARMRPGSHHFAIYTLAGAPAPVIPGFDVVRDIRNRDGSLNLVNMAPMAYHVFLGGAMAQSSDYQFPAGVALRVPPNTALDLNPHYVNQTVTEFPGEAYANFYTVDSAQVQRVARTLNLANTSITLPPRQRTTVTRTFTMNTRTTVFMLTSHMHYHGEKFVIQIAGGPRNGEVVYESRDWAHPAMLTLDQPLTLDVGQGLTSVVTYNNTTGLAITFGLTSEDEMGIIFGYAY
ncbi:MAG: hypothetical protein EXR93_11760 [Gemmatimonadetes bacterium]|nr:hypothetical protein [Gemmatimonadota bacterium]